ncbi:FimV/HubP family polar landmark protein [Shewanella maritima]|uniref:FimV/HubP family polar landmark protein n=1 Tax=Shewanella maritima TaxID=2520507 RepID=UPI0037353E92
MKALTALAIAVTLAISTAAPVSAEISHVGIDTKQFEAGALPIISVVVTTEHKDLSRLNFYLRQVYSGNIVLEKLEVISYQGDRLSLRGKEAIQDPKAALIVSEYRHSKWQQYKPVAVFSESSFSNNKSPVGIKRMKPSTSAEPDTMTAQAYTSGDSCIVLRDTGDTLWSIASKNSKQWGTNVFGAMLAIYEANPRAFTRGDITRLMADRRLTCPDEAILSQFVDSTADKQTYDALVAGGKQITNTETIDTKTIDTKTIDTKTIDTKTIDTETSQPHVMHAEPIKETKAAEELVTDTFEQDSVLPAEFESAEPQPMSAVAQVDNAPVVSDSAPDINAMDDAMAQALANDELVQMADELPVQLTAENCIIERNPEDTLWQLASMYREQWRVGVFDAMLAIYDANPRGFSERKIQKMRADVDLKCPSEDLLTYHRENIGNKAKFEQLVESQR